MNEPQHINQPSEAPAFVFLLCIPSTEINRLFAPAGNLIGAALLQGLISCELILEGISTAKVYSIGDLNLCAMLLNGSQDGRIPNIVKRLQERVIPFGVFHCWRIEEEGPVQMYPANLVPFALFDEVVRAARDKSRLLDEMVLLLKNQPAE